jgi:hypothetical protein
MLPLGKPGAVKLEFRSADKVFDPQSVYGTAPDKPKR